MRQIAHFILIGLIFVFSNLHGDIEPKARILVGSPVRQKPLILNEFLESLKRQDMDGYQLDYYFIDDNDNNESSETLNQFKKDVSGNCFILKQDLREQSEKYVCNEVTHFWKDALIWKVAAFKDKIIEYADKNHYDYLFLIDSDIVLHPKTIAKLKEAKKDIISNIFWTSWSPGAMEQPQVWLFDEYTQYRVIPGVEKSDLEKCEEIMQFYNMLRTPGIYEVGGLGACTLISQNAIKKGVNFKKIPNLTFWGEDRHFCIRAASLGLSLFVDTHYPAYHIYREANLKGVEDYIRSTKENEKKGTITLSMIVKNESGRYLKQVLESAKNYIDYAVIIDDASDDDSVEVIKEALKGIPLHLVQNDHSLFSNEVNLRKLQFEETIKTNPDWILFLDADEMFEPAFKDNIKQLISDSTVDVYYFRLYDFWNETQYRDDIFWSAHHYYRPYLMRYNPNFKYEWKEQAQHCGRLPVNISLLPYRTSEMRLKHYGWAKEKDRIEKYERYKKLDPDATYGWKEQYDSILDKNPNLVTWID